MSLTKRRRREILSEFKMTVSVVVEKFPDYAPESRVKTIQACHRRSLNEKNDNLRQVFQALTLALTKLHNAAEAVK